MYTIISFLSRFIRENMLPNPFEVLCEEFNVDFFGLVVPMTPDLFMFLLETFVLGSVTYFIVGRYYRKGVNSPVRGSILYLSFYCLHIGLLHLMSMFYFNAVACGIIIAVYLILHIIVLYYKHNSYLMRRRHKCVK